MYSDPFYRQLIRVMQENGKEVTTTRQSARYKDELQTNRTTPANIIKQKARKRFKVEIPADYTIAKIDTINRVIWQWKIARMDAIRSERLERIEYLKKRISELKELETHKSTSDNKPKEQE